ncbi:hypothetical protein CALCODRAFT_487214 [Calocera cornea HHB12733]|uniref:Uncharacterized protein n=1 Tax=Calocera cornea HHB12733 TaxID=1353952 RepID=A0A165D8W2_9BASI|nr:hypothetical protein CALCODRAFT_487214 [Calocera cornea HHB12733]
MDAVDHQLQVAERILVRWNTRKTWVFLIGISGGLAVLAAVDGQTAVGKRAAGVFANAGTLITTLYNRSSSAAFVRVTEDLGQGITNLAPAVALLWGGFVAVYGFGKKEGLWGGGGGGAGRAEGAGGGAGGEEAAGAGGGGVGGVGVGGDGMA